jgi:hypothetical protein
MRHDNVSETIGIPPGTSWFDDALLGFEYTKQPIPNAID